MLPALPQNRAARRASSAFIEDFLRLIDDEQSLPFLYLSITFASYAAWYPDSEIRVISISASMRTSKPRR